MSLEISPADPLPPIPNTPVSIPTPAPEIVASEFTEFDEADDDLEDFDDDFDDEFEEELEGEYDFGENEEFDESHYAKPIGNDEDKDFDGEADEENDDTGDGDDADEEEDED